MRRLNLILASSPLSLFNYGNLLAIVNKMDELHFDSDNNGGHAVRWFPVVVL